MPVKKAPLLSLALSPEWVELIKREEVAPAHASLLSWPTDCECGREIIKVIGLADAVALLWPDVAQNVRAIAVEQILIIAHG